MTKKRSTKRALISSILALCLCFTMLIGTTYAWFTDSAVSADNKIQSGTLDVDLLLWDGQQYVDISENQDPIFGTAGLAQDSLDTLWEPGKTQVAYLAITNNGTLDLKYLVNIAVTGYTKNLYEVMEYDIIPNASEGTGVTEWTGGTSVVPGNNKTQAKDVVLAANATHYFALAVHMDELAGNEYQDGEITFDINVLATQLAAESDSFNNSYDAAATYPAFGSATAVVDGTKNEYDVTVYDTQVEGENNKQKIGYAYIPDDAVAEGATNVNVTITKKEAVDSNVTVASDKAALTFDVSVSNLKENNDTPVKVAIRIGEGYTGVKFFHKGVEIPYGVANKNADGEYFVYIGEYIEFYSKSFSPFTVVYDKEAMVLPPVDDVVPVATVEELENYAIDKWEIAPGSSDQQLDAVFSFKAPASSESSYNDWLCDYYVKLVTDNAEMTTLPAGSITLGGNYGEYGWIGFDNPEVDTNTFIPLLGSVLAGDYTGEDGVNTYWTYERVRDLVGNFLCGVAVAEGAPEDLDLTGAKFVVELRLTNPDDHAEYIAVNTVIYDFTTGNSSFSSYKAQ